MGNTPMRSIRVGDNEWRVWQDAAALEKVDLSAWVRMACNVRAVDLAANIEVGDLGGRDHLELVRTETVPADSAGQAEEVVPIFGDESVGQSAYGCTHPRKYRETKGPLVRCSTDLGGCGARL